MPIIIKGGDNTPKEYTPHPEVQGAPATCIDCLDLGWSSPNSPFGPKYRVALVFWTGVVEKVERDGEMVDVPLTVAKFFNASLNEKSNLTKFIQQWMGRSYKLPDGNLEELLGQNAMISVEHNDTGTKVYANITSIMGLPPTMVESAPGVPEGFVRLCEREDWAGPAQREDLGSTGAAPDGTTDAMPWD